MSLKEAEAVGDLLSLADNNCRYCVQQLVDAANEVFPEFKWEMVLNDFKFPSVIVKENHV